MLILVCLLVVGVVFGRKQFTYLEILPGLYVVECVMLLLSAAIMLRVDVLMNYGPTGSVKGRLVLPPVTAMVSFFCLMLAIVKVIEHVTIGGAAAQFQELPILVYPFFLTVILVWMTQLTHRNIELMHRVLELAILSFPLYFLALYASGTLDLLTLLDKPLWPNNDFVFATCLLVAIFYREHYPTLLIWASASASLVGVLVEAQRGTFVCLALAIILLMRRITQAVQLTALVTAALLIVSVFGADLSYRFENGISDLGDFFTSVTENTNDPRYSSTEHRAEMWAYVFDNALTDPFVLAVGKPIAKSIVPEAWRNPHNGYVSALGRGGIITLFFYLLLLMDAVRALLHSRRHHDHVLVHILYFTGCMDAMTQTVFDSPYSLFIVILAAALSMHARTLHHETSRYALQPS